MRQTCREHGAASMGQQSMGHLDRVKKQVRAAGDMRWVEHDAVDTSSLTVVRKQ